MRVFANLKVIYFLNNLNSYEVRMSMYYGKKEMRPQNKFFSGPKRHDL